MINLQIIKSAYKPFILNWLYFTFMGGLIIFITLFDKINNKNFTVAFASMFPVEILLQSMLFMSIANALVTNEVERGHLTYFLSSLLTRTKIIMSKMSFYIILLFITNLVLLIMGFIWISIFKIDIGYDKFALLVFGLFLLTFVICGVLFFFSTIFNRTAWLLTLGAGVIFVFCLLWIIAMIANGTGLHILNYFSLNILYNPYTILTESVDQWILPLAISFIIGLCLYIGSVFIFKNKDLPL